MQGEKHWNWKGDKIGYSQIHVWHNKYCKKSGVCSHCGERKKTEWALRKGKEHSRDIENYIELCCKCHVKYDKTEEWTKKCVEALKKTYTHQNPIQPKKCEHCTVKFFPAKKQNRFCSTKCSAQARPIAVRERDLITGRWLALNKK